MSSHSRAGAPLPRRGRPVPLTTHNELALPAHSGRCVAGYARIVAVVLEGDAGDLQGAHELLALDGHARARDDHLPVFPPRDADGHVPRGHHTGDVEQLADGGRRELKGLDERGHWKGRGCCGQAPTCPSLAGSTSTPAWPSGSSLLCGLQTESPGCWCLFSYIYMQNLLGALTSSLGFHPLAYPGLGSALSPGPGLACIHHHLQICPGT